jgi:hypothetical protein
VFPPTPPFPPACLQLHSEALTALASSGDAAAAAALSAVSAEIVKQRNALVVPRALLHDSAQAATGRLRDQLADALLSAGCSLTVVADGEAAALPQGAARMSRADYMVSTHTGTCDAL